MQTEKKFSPKFNIFLPEDLGKEAFIHFTDNQGERHRIKGGINRFHTLEKRRAAAEALVAKLQTEWKPVQPLCIQMLDWVELYRGTWWQKTYRSIKSIVSVFLDWLGARVPTAALMKEYFSAFSATHHAKTYNEHLFLFRRLFKHLELSHLLAGLEIRKAISTPAKYFQSYQIQRIKKRLNETDPSLWQACQFIYFCFIRPRELRLLKIGDIYFDESKVCVRSEISKNKKEQYVTISLAFRPALESLKHRSPNAYVFPSKKDVTKPMGANALLNRFRKILTELGFGMEYKLYSWKHTGAVAAVRAGISIKELQIQLRHHSLDEVDKYLRQLGPLNTNPLFSNKFFNTSFGSSPTSCSAR